MSVKPVKALANYHTSDTDFLGSKRAVLAAGGMIFVLVLILYLYLPTKDYYWDGVYFSLNIQKAVGIEPFLFHPNHLLYEVVGYWAYKLAGLLGLHFRSLNVLQIIDSIFGALAAVVVYAVLIRSIRSLYIACCCTILFSFAAAWWRYSTDADAYVLSVLLMLLAFYWVLPSSDPHPAWVGVAHSASMVCHELAVFLYPVLLLGLVFQTAPSSVGRRCRVLGEYTATAGMLTLGTYWWGFTAQAEPHGLERFLRWITYSSPGTHFSFNFWRNLSESIKGQIQLFFGGRFTLMAKYANPAILILLTILFALCLAFVYLLIRHTGEVLAWWRALVSRSGNLSALRTLSLLWIILYVIFLFCWLPQNTFYRLFYLPPIIFLLAVALSRVGKLTTVRRRLRTAAFAGIVLLWNMVFYTFPYSHATSNPVVSMAIQMRSVWPSGTHVYYEAFDSDNWYFDYLNPQTNWRQINSPYLQNLNNQLLLDNKKGRGDWIDITLANSIDSTPEGQNWLLLHTNWSSVYKLTNGHQIRFAELRAYSNKSTKPETGNEQVPRSLAPSAGRK